MKQGWRGFRVGAILACALSALAASPASATPTETISVLPSASYTGGMPAPTQIQLTNTSDAGEIADFEGIDLFPGCNTTNPECVPAGTAREIGLFTLSATGTGFGDPNVCNGSWDLIESRDNPGRWSFVPGRIGYFDFVNMGDSCTLSFTATANRLPSTDVNPIAPGVQTNFVADARVYYPGGPVHDASDFAEVTVAAAPPKSTPPATPPPGATGQRASALAKCKKKKSKKKRKKCRKAAQLLPV